jgi:hypothetical protein
VILQQGLGIADRIDAAIIRQRWGKHTSAATIEEPMDAVFYMLSAPKLYNEDELDGINTVSTRVEADSNTSTVTLRVVGGKEKGSLKSEKVKYGHESQETRTRERLRWRGPAAYTKDRTVLSDERTPQKNKTVTVKNKKYLVMNLRWGSTPRLTD